MNKTLFGKTVTLKDHHCRNLLNSNQSISADVEEPYANIYVRIQNVCNAKCKFCEFTGENKHFDKYKMYYALSEMQKKFLINKVSFTGGEPTLDIDTLSEAIKLVKEVNKNAFIVVNTNGYNLDGLVGLPIDSVALSRHHYSDSINNEILGFNAPSSLKIKELSSKLNLHLSCNLLKDNIDSIDEIIKYLHFADSVDVDDVGFVSLMKVNDFCKNNFVDFHNIGINDDERLFRNKEWKYKDICKCANYLYIVPNTGNVIKFYSRCALKPHCTDSQLVFDCNVLKDGFNGNILI